MKSGGGAMAAASSGSGAASTPARAPSGREGPRRSDLGAADRKRTPQGNPVR